MAKQKLRSTPDLTFEEQWVKKGFECIAGIDEAGRGPIAGPVIAAAVILDHQNIPQGIRDSKELSPARREKLYDEISRHASIGVATATVERIDQDNILQATLWAMARACEALTKPAQVALIDGNIMPYLSCPGETIVGGDRKSLSIAAASIIAKVTRDRLMRNLAKHFPQYGFERHSGYPTKDHINLLDQFGPCPHHRRTFAPVTTRL
jgi:ribonuclease HII